MGFMMINKNYSLILHLYHSRNARDVGPPVYLINVRLDDNIAVLFTEIDIYFFNVSMRLQIIALDLYIINMSIAHRP